MTGVYRTMIPSIPSSAKFRSSVQTQCIKHTLTTDTHEAIRMGVSEGVEGEVCMGRVDGALRKHVM